MKRFGWRRGPAKRSSEEQQNQEERRFLLSLPHLCPDLQNPVSGQGFGQPGRAAGLGSGTFHCRSKSPGHRGAWSRSHRKPRRRQRPAGAGREPRASGGSSPRKRSHHKVLQRVRHTPNSRPDHLRQREVSVSKQAQLDPLLAFIMSTADRKFCRAAECSNDSLENSFQHETLILHTHCCQRPKPTEYHNKCRL